MNKNLTDITLVVDRSGSMSSCMVEAQTGINTFINEQKKAAGDVTFSLLQFDTEHEYVFNGVPIAQVGEYILVPRNFTALLDAVGKAITETGARLESMTEKERPGLVVIAIITDGQENSSTKFTKGSIKDMINKQQIDYSWQFTFLGANQDAFAEAGSIGISAAAASSYDTANTRFVYTSLSDNISRMAHATSTGQTVNCTYTDAEREKMIGVSSGSGGTQ